MSKESTQNNDVTHWINSYPGAVSKESKSNLEKEVKKDKMDTLKEEAQAIVNDGNKQEQRLKRDICGWVKLVVSLYLIFVGFILTMLVFGKGELSDGAIIALLTTTTINILGLPLMIILSLFPSKK